jgi:hypothetical protein
MMTWFRLHRPKYIHSAIELAESFAARKLGGTRCIAVTHSIQRPSA